MKIVVYETEPWEREAFAALADDHEVICREGPLAGEVEPDCRDADVVSAFIYSSLGSDVLDQFEHLQLLATRSTGVDHVDVDWCDRHGVAVCNVPSYGENTVAEHVFALLLAISHHLVEAADRTRRGDFSQTGLQGFDLQGRTMGIVGTGHIGRHAASIARGFDMTVLAYDTAPDAQAAEACGFRYVDLETLLAEADIVSLHVPGTAATRHLIDEARFAQMKDGVVLINTARGSVVDVQALLRALASGKVRAAGLDVLPDEPTVREEAELLRRAFTKEHDLETLLADHILLRLKNVIITPHSAFNTREAVARILATTRANIEAFARGEPANVVNRPGR